MRVRLAARHSAFAYPSHRISFSTRQPARTPLKIIAEGSSLFGTTSGIIDAQPAGKAKRKNGKEALVAIRDKSNGEAPSAFISQVAAARLRNIADRLQAIAHELRQFEKTTNDPGLKQAGTSAAMALAWIGLVDNLQANDGTEISDTSPDERQRTAMNIHVNEKRNSQSFAGGVFAIS